MYAVVRGTSAAAIQRLFVTAHYGLALANFNQPFVRFLGSRRTK